MEDKIGSDIMLLDIRSQTAIADYFVICSADNERQVRAIVEHIDKMVSKDFARNPRIDGIPAAGWVILDYGDVVVHVFSTAQREYYQLERLWSQAQPVVVLQ